MIKCIRENCDSIGLFRGCCPKHYNQTLKEIKQGLLTWKEAEEKGLLKPKKKSNFNDKPKI